MNEPTLDNQASPYPRLAKQWWVLVLALCVFASIAAYITRDQHRLNLEKALQTTQERYLLVEALVLATLEAGNYEGIQHIFDQWGVREPDLYRLSLTTRNGYVHGEYLREEGAVRARTLSGNIEYGYRGVAKLSMTTDIGWVYEQLNRLIVQMLIAVTLVGLLGAYFVSGMARRQRRSNRFQEISRRLTETNARLDQETTLLRSLIDSIPDLIYLKDPDGAYLGCNRAYTRYSGRPVEEHLARTDLDISKREDAELQHQRDMEVLASGSSSRSEEWVEYPDGTQVLLDTLRTPFSGPDGELRGVIGIGRDITEIKRIQAQLEQLAYHDSLTRLPNRRYLVDRMQHDMALAVRQGTLLAVCALDIDGFKPVNDLLGHAAGDKVLMEFAKRLQKDLRSEDTLARWGGDEFSILMCGLKEENECAVLLARIQQRVTQPFIVDDHTFSLSASIGVTLFPQDHVDADTLLRHADQAMYQAKQGGKNRYAIFDPEKDRSIHSHRENIARVEAAVRNDEMCLYYQPQVHMRSGRVHGVEALVRWQHPQHGLLVPEKFLPLIQDQEAGITLDWWVLEQALTQLARWRDQDIDLVMSVNLSALTLQQPDFISRLDRLLAGKPSLPPGLLQLEILETASLENLDQVSAVMMQCHRLGVSFTLDDFGTGYSSLTYLRRLPAQALKIDRSFVRDMLVDQDDLNIVKGILELAHTFDRQLVAEGVESVEHGQRLIGLGCSHAQGNAIARPMPPQELPGWLASYRPPREWMVMAVQA